MSVAYQILHVTLLIKRQLQRSLGPIVRGTVAMSTVISGPLSRSAGCSPRCYNLCHKV